MLVCVKIKGVTFNKTNEVYLFGKLNNLVVFLIDTFYFYTSNILIKYIFIFLDQIGIGNQCIYINQTRLSFSSLYNRKTN